MTSPLTDVQRCGLSELPVDSCGCRRHRGGMTPQEQVEADRVRWVDRVFIARHPGVCEVCDEPIRTRQPIARVGEGRYRHADCEED